MSGKLEKMERDWSSEVDELIPRNNQIEEAFESLLALEKQCRSSADLASTSRILVEVVRVCRNIQDWKRLNESVVLLSKKHGQLKQAITNMVKEAMIFLDETPDLETQLELISTLRTVTDGKIYVEVERAHLTKRLAKIREDEGKIAEASEILQELQVETFGSMEKREKTEFILEQMRLCLLNKDYIRTVIISKKINTAFFKNNAHDDLKLIYYTLLIEYALHEEDYLSVCKYYREIYSTKQIQSNDEGNRAEVLANILLYAVLAPYDNEQSDLLHRITLPGDKYLNEVKFQYDMVKTFTKPELMRWPIIESRFGSQLTSIDIFKAGTPDGHRRWEAFHSRVIEHNIRVIAKYYTRITTTRLTELLDLVPDETEAFLSKLVVSKTIFARIDRPNGIVSFKPRLDSSGVLSSWTSDINSILKLVESTSHLIAKEEMVHKVSQSL